MRISILGKTWKVVWVPKGEEYYDEDGDKILGKKDFGAINPPDAKGKCIYLREGLTAKELADTLIHEFLHGVAYEQFAEKWINRVAGDLTAALSQLGLLASESPTRCPPPG